MIAGIRSLFGHRDGTEAALTLAVGFLIQISHTTPTLIFTWRINEKFSPTRM
jgi:hypothetical protein